MSGPQRLQEGPAVLGLGGGQVLLRGAAVVDVWRSVAGAVEVARRRDGMVAPARLSALLMILEREAAEVMARVRQGDVAHVSEVPGSSRGNESELGRIGVELCTREVAEALGTSIRTAQRLAATGIGRRVGGRWLVDPASVAELADERQTR